MINHIEISTNDLIGLIEKPKLHLETQYLHKEADGTYTTIDNRTGEAWVEHWDTLQLALNWINTDTSISVETFREINCPKTKEEEWPLPEINFIEHLKNADECISGLRLTWDEIEHLAKLAKDNIDTLPTILQYKLLVPMNVGKETFLKLQNEFN